jgi:hypothetical protein
LTLLALVSVWLSRRAWRRSLRRELRVFSLFFATTLAVFALQGYGRTDGIGFNQRYFLELLPLGAIALAWIAEQYQAPARPLVVGAACAGAVALGLMMLDTEAPLRLVLALAAAASWLVARRGRPNMLLAVTSGACLAWALTVHLGDDLRASRAVRHYNLARQVMLERVLPQRGALFAMAHFKDPAGPLLLDRDLVIVDPAIDRGRDAPRLVDELLAGGRRVFVDITEFPPPLFHRMRGKRPVAVVAPGTAPIMEIIAQPAER